MKKLLSLVLSLMLALGCMGALAEDAAPQQNALANSFALPLPYTVDVDISINEALISMLMPLFAPDADSEVVNMVLPLINGLGMQGVVVEEGIQGSLTLKDMPLFSLDYLFNENEAIVASDLFPSYALSLPLDTQMMGEMSEVNVDEVMAVINPHVNALAEKFGAYLESTEEGEFTVGGAAFKHRGKVQFTVQELEKLMGEFVDGLKQDEKVIALLESLGMDVLLQEGVVPAYEAEEEESEAGEPIVLYFYLSEDQANFAVTFEIAQDEMVVNAQLTGIDQVVNLEMLMGADIFLSRDDMRQAALSGSDDAVLLNVVIAMEGMKDFSVKLDAYMGMYVGLSLAYASREDQGMDMNAGLYFLFEDQPLLSVAGSYIPGGQLTSPLTIEGKTVISMATPTNVEDYEAYQSNVASLGMEVASVGLNNIIANAAAAMPEEITALVTYLTAPAEPVDGVVIDGVN